MPYTSYQRGDLVIYRKTKSSTKPGPRAKDVRPAEHGDLYSYHVDKFWVVAGADSETDSVLLQTRRGKEHLTRIDDPNLRSANWFKRWWYRDRFPALPEGSLEDDRHSASPSPSRFET